jgi:catechol 2,3-dioxygenase-like lactoylglutathione lyase family enzyme
MIEYKLELVVVPVTDVDRAKAFYSERCGFVVDVDQSVGDAFRVVQLTPLGSACSISIGKGLSKSEPGSTQGLQLCVGDIDAARADLAGRGVDISPVRRFGTASGSRGAAARGTRSPSSVTPRGTAGRSRRNQRASFRSGPGSRASAEDATRLQRIGTPVRRRLLVRGPTMVSSRPRARHHAHERIP